MMRYLYCILIMLISTLSLNAQQQPSRGGAGGAVQMKHPIGGNTQMRPPMIVGAQSPNSILNLYVVVMKEHLELTTKQSKKFETLYSKYYKELSALTKTKIEINNRTTDEEIERQIYESLDITDKTTELKRKYYPLFKEILSVRQIFMMYDIERELLLRITLESQRRLEAKMN